MGLKRLILLLLVSMVVTPVVCAQVDLDTLSGQAFTAIVAAEDAGGEVDELLVRLNTALDLIGEGSDENLTSARSILDELLVDVEAIRVAGVQEGNWNAGVAIVKVVVLVSLAAAVWLRGDEYFWRLWRRTKEGYILE